MSRRDNCEQQVIAALQKANWQILREQIGLTLAKRRYVYIDLEVQPFQQTQPALVIEIKCFNRPKLILDDFYGAMGQYVFYRNMIRQAQWVHTLYLAVPHFTYRNLFQLSPIQATLKELKVNVLVIHLEQERIEQWHHY